ncbi:MAG: translation elongation factor Ts [Minwuiales bacterium]|nr:translation elongation factor Ts [Minwuiales bacterium]
MAEITAAMVKELRTASGAGMMDCKKALTESGGDIEAAVDWLRKKGLSAAAKKAGRVAAEGLVAVATGDGKGAVVELNAETDFVARNEQFQGLVKAIAEIAFAQTGGLDAVLAADYPGTGRTVADELTNAIATIGENMNLRRVALVEAIPGVVAAYVHNATAPGMGKIGVLVGVKSEGDVAKVEALGKQIAMHVAAANPLSLTVDDLDPAAVERERSVLVEQAKASGKPDNIIDKMVEGRLRKFYQEVVLMEQNYVIDPDITVAKAVENAASEIGSAVEITGFVRFALGEGIEKQEADFAAEVAATAAS